MNTFNKIPLPALKICGLTRTEDVMACERYEIDFIGLNFFEGSKRWVSVGTAKALLTHSSRCKAVGVFVNHGIDEVVTICKALPNLSVVQLHGSEPVEFAEMVREKTGKQVWKAISVKEPEDLERVIHWEKVADLVLLDGHQPGSGLEFDWMWLRQLQTKQPWGLAGGIRTSNMNRAVASKPFLIDVASGAEEFAGLKDAKLIAHFAQVIKEARKDG